QEAEATRVLAEQRRKEAEDALRRAELYFKIIRDSQRGYIGPDTPAFEVAELRQSFERALKDSEEAYPRDKYPRGHPGLAASLRKMGVYHFHQGEYDKADSYFQRTLEMQNRLYPKAQYPYGHPDLASTLIAIGTVLEVQREYARAMDYYRKALVMNEKLYPVS